MKTFVLRVAKTFPHDHARKGENTGFRQLIEAGQKIHTIRNNTTDWYWKHVAEEVNAGKAILSLREWDARPYHSGQTEFMQLTKIGLQQVDIDPAFYSTTVEGKEKDRLIIARNDGLNQEDFDNWFRKKTSGVIIHFTDFRY